MILKKQHQIAFLNLGLIAGNCFNDCLVTIIPLS